MYPRMRALARASLPVVQAIMQAHGGSILLQSQKGGGTDALLTLPAEEPADRTLLKSPRVTIDRSGGAVPELVELSDVLPPEVFDVPELFYKTKSEKPPLSGRTGAVVSPITSSACCPQRP